MTKTKARPCAFTGLPPYDKIRVPEDDPHTWIEIPCCADYKRLRSANDTLGSQLRMFEDFLARHFIMSELFIANLHIDKLGFYQDDIMATKIRNENRLMVEVALAEEQRDRGQVLETGMTEVLAKREEALD